MRCMLALSMCGVGQVFAFTYTCQISLEANPPFPETISSTQVVGTVIYQGTLTWQFRTCTSANHQELLPQMTGISLVAGGTDPHPIYGVKGLSVQAGPPTFTNLYKANDPRIVDVTVTTNSYSHIYHMTGNFWWRNYTVLTSSFNSFDITQNIIIKASNTTVSGKFPDPSRGNYLVDRLDWRQQTTCMAGPWVVPYSFSDCSWSLTAMGAWGYYTNPNTYWAAGEPQIGLTPAVPRIVNGSASTDQNCRPVLRSSITIPNLKKP